MEWSQSHMFWWILPVLGITAGVAYLLFRKKQRLKRQWSGRASQDQLFRFRWIQLGLFFLGGVLLVLALAGLREGEDPIEKELETQNVIVAIDVSNSMLARDIQPDRLTLAKNLVLNLAGSPSVEAMGVIAFAGEAYVLMPLTADLSAAPSFVQHINTETIGVQGTRISSVLQVLTDTFSGRPLEELSLVLISDGEDHDEATEERAKEAVENGLVIHAVGVGTPEGARIPLDGRTSNQYLRNRDNEPVRTRLKEGFLRELADLGGGQYLRFESPGSTASALLNALENAQRTSSVIRRYQSYRYFNHYFIIAAFICYLLAMFIRWKYTS